MCREEINNNTEPHFKSEPHFEMTDDMTSFSNAEDRFDATSQEHSLSCRIKVHFLGDTNAGKTSLVQSLVTECAYLAKVPTEGINRLTWQPFKGTPNDNLLGRIPSVDEKTLSLDLWDMSGRKACQGIHQIFLSRALFVIVFNMDDPHSCQHLPMYISAVQARVPGSPILLVGTRADKFFTGEERKQKADETLACVNAAQFSQEDAIKNDITEISDMGADSKLLSQLEWLESLLENRPQIHPSIFIVSCKTGKGLNLFRRQLVTMALDCTLFPHKDEGVNAELARVLELLEEKRTKGSLLITWKEYGDILKQASTAESDTSSVETTVRAPVVQEEELTENTLLLQMSGALCVFHAQGRSLRTEPPVQYICTAPHQLATLLCNCHLDNHRKAFKIESKRFWSETSTRPEAGVLVKMLEEIPQHGVVRDVLLPLLWQGELLPEPQFRRVLDLLGNHGLFVSCSMHALDHLQPSQHPNNAVVILPDYPNLSPTTRHHAVLMNLIPDKRPHLNWTPKPLKGDLQLNWRFAFPRATPHGLTSCMLGMFHAATDSKTYTHHWHYGILVKQQDAIVCIEVDTLDLYVDIMCRVTYEDDQATDAETIEFLWAHLAPYVRDAYVYLNQWPGIVYKCELVPFGLCFYQEETIGGDQTFLLFQCLMAAKNDQPIKFTDGGVERSLNAALLFQLDVSRYQSIEDWLTYILQVREGIIESRKYIPLLPIPCQSGAAPNPLSERKKKQFEVKWDLPEAETHMNKLTVDIENKNTLSNCSNDQVSSEDIKQQADVGDKLANGRLFIEEDLNKEATRVASCFVAAILAQAVAEYIGKIHEDNHDNPDHEKINIAQVHAANLTAEAVIAAQTGEVEGAARLVISAARALHVVPQPVVKSKACQIL